VDIVRAWFFDDDKVSHQREVFALSARGVLRLQRCKDDKMQAIAATAASSIHLTM
jgi:hypothetical protein